MPLARIARGDIHYECKGSGPPLVLALPQSGGPVGVEPFVDGLAKAFSVVRYDQRGTGRSPPPAPADRISMADRADEVFDLLRALDIPRTSLFCHSTGCGIGLAFAAGHADRLDRLALAAPWSHADSYLTTMQRLRIAAAAALDPCAYARFNASLLFPPAYRRRHETGFSTQATAAKPQDASQIAARLNAILAFDSRPLTPAILCPTLVMTAADDQLMPPWFGREIARSMPDARYIELQGGGHMLPETRTSELLDLVGGFLRASG